MPNGRAAMAREWLAAQDKSNVVLERVPPGRRSKTGSTPRWRGFSHFIVSHSTGRACMHLTF